MKPRGPFRSKNGLYFSSRGVIISEGNKGLLLYVVISGRSLCCCRTVRMRVVQSPFARYVSKVFLILLAFHNFFSLFRHGASALIFFWKIEIGEMGAVCTEEEAESR